jgi:hypothetical protein
LWNILLAYPNKNATAVCTLAFCPAPHADPVLFTGVTRGTIIAPKEVRFRVREWRWSLGVWHIPRVCTH